MSDSLYADIFKSPEPEVKTFADTMKAHREKDLGKTIGQAKKISGLKEEHRKLLEEAEGFDGQFDDDVPKEGIESLMSGGPEKVVVATYTTQESGGIGIEHGWNHEDYVWHIGTRRGKGWKVSGDRVIFAMAKTMSSVIPQSVRIDVYPPKDEWELKEYTVKALQLRAAWNVSPQQVLRLTEKLFEVLNTLV